MEKSTLNITNHNGGNVKIEPDKKYPNATWKFEGSIDGPFINEALGALVTHLIKGFGEVQRMRDQRNLWLTSLSEEQRMAVLGGPKVMMPNHGHDECPLANAARIMHIFCTGDNEQKEQSDVQNEQQTHEMTEPIEETHNDTQPEEKQPTDADLCKAQEDVIAQQICDLVKSSSINPMLLLGKVKDLYFGIQA